MGNHGGFGREKFWKAKGKRRWQVNLEVNFDSLFNLFNRNSKQILTASGSLQFASSHPFFYRFVQLYIYIHILAAEVVCTSIEFSKLGWEPVSSFHIFDQKKGSAFNKTPPTVIPLMNPLDDHLSGDEFLSFRKALNIKKSHKNLRWKEINLDLSWLFLWYKLFGKILKNCHDNPSWYNLTTWIICL